MQALSCRVEMIVVVLEVGDVDQTFNIDISQLHKQTKTGNRCHSAIELIANPVLHVLAFQPVNNTVTRGIGAPLGNGTAFAETVHGGIVVGVDRGFVELGSLIVATHMLTGLVANQVADAAMHQQIRITANGRREVRVCLEAEPEVTDVIGRVNSLHHRADQHHLKQMSVWSVLALLNHTLVVCW